MSVDSSSGAMGRISASVADLTRRSMMPVAAREMGRLWGISTVCGFGGRVCRSFEASMGG